MTVGTVLAGKKTPEALVFDDASTISLGGMTLAERAVLLAHRAGLTPIHVWGRHPAGRDLGERLQGRGVSVVQPPPDRPPLESLNGDRGGDRGIVVIGPEVLFGPSALTALASLDGEAGDAATAVYDPSAAPLLLYVPPNARADLRACRSIEAMTEILSKQGTVRALPPAGMFCRRVDRADLIASSEREYIRHLNGRGESYFTKKIRRFSVPLTSRLVRLGAKPTHVTLGGLVLAAAAAWSMAQGRYALGVLGGVLYYTSMIFDCSDGEVARLTVRDDPFGAWLETMVDYLTYFLMLAALTVASRSRAGADAYRVAAMVALAGSIVVAVVAGYLRHRVAAADPGQFDDASAKALASASRFHRFARWGRQWIKRSTVAHLVVVLALVNQLPALLYLWAFGATVASVVILAVEPFVVRRVAVAPAGVRNVDAGGQL